jgi:ABC-type antimicrobial peptide transport system permease subunit
MALGSTRLEILSQVICEALRTVIIGIVIGLGMAVVLARFLRTLLYGIEPIDPWTFSAGVLLMTTCAVAASGIPALRAASLNVVKALRYE